MLYQLSSTASKVTVVGAPPGVEASDPLVLILLLGGSELKGGSLSPPDLFLLFLPILQLIKLISK